MRQDFFRQLYRMKNNQSFSPNVKGVEVKIKKGPNENGYASVLVFESNSASLFMATSPQLFGKGGF